MSHHGFSDLMNLKKPKPIENKIHAAFFLENTLNSPDSVVFILLQDMPCETQLLQK